jgi:hypothetical protein
MNNPDNLLKRPFSLRQLKNLFGKIRLRGHDTYPAFCKPKSGNEGKSDIVGFVTTKHGGFPIINEWEEKAEYALGLRLNDTLRKRSGDKNYSFPREAWRNSLMALLQPHAGANIVNLADFRKGRKNV